MVRTTLLATTLLLAAPACSRGMPQQDPNALEPRAPGTLVVGQTRELESDYGQLALEARPDLARRKIVARIRFDGGYDARLQLRLWDKSGRELSASDPTPRLVVVGGTTQTVEFGLPPDVDPAAVDRALVMRLAP